MRYKLHRGGDDIEHAINKIKNKKAFVNSTEFVIFFTVAVLLCVMLFEMTIAVFSMYNMNIAASNVARNVSISGELTQETSRELYEQVEAQLKGRIVADSLEISLETRETTTDYVPAQKVTITKDITPTYKVNIGDDFIVRLKAKVVLFHIGSKDVKATISSSSSGVGEVYFKS